LISKISILQEHGADGIYGSFFLKDNVATKEIKFHTQFPSDYGIADKIAAFQTHDARTTTLVFKREKFEMVKFDDKLHKHQDWDTVINFEKAFKLVLDEKPTAIIHVDSLHARMSNNLKHESTLYFLTKNYRCFKPKGLFNFCVKMVMRCQALSDNKAIPAYLSIIDNVYHSLSLKNKLLYHALKRGLINLNTIRLIKNSLNRVLS
jgi:hypothetical protein